MGKTSLYFYFFCGTITGVSMSGISYPRDKIIARR